MIKVKYEDYFGFEIKNLMQANTVEEQIKALEEHYSMLEGCTNEALSDIEGRIARLKYPNNFKD